MGKALEFIISEPWAIQRESGDQILEIVQQHKALSGTAMESKLEAIAAKIDRPLDNTRNVTERNGVAIIPLNGPVFPKANLFTAISGAHSLEMVALDFNAALEDPGITHIVMYYESAPGGVFGGINEFAHMIRAANKPVISYVGIMAASSHYFLAAAGDRIVIDAAAMVGNVGVVFRQRKTSDDGDVEIVSSRAPDKRPDLGTEEGRAVVQTELDALEDVFIGCVADFQGMTVEDVAAHRGRILVGAAAVEAGFADELGSFESVMAGISGAHPQEDHFMADTKPDAPEITREYLAANHPDIVAAIEADAAATARTEGVAVGATNERERIQSVLDQSMPGHEALIQGLAFDGKTAGPEAAVAVLQAEKAGRAKHRANMRKETPPPVLGASELDDDKKDEDKTFEGKINAYQADGMTRGKAMATAARNHPALHKEWLARINKASQGEENV